MINEDFADVTLVTEDKKQIKANGTILSACSPVFKDIFKKDNRSSTIMYLRGIQYSEMESIMQFIYLCKAKPESNKEPNNDQTPCDPQTSTNELEQETNISAQMEEPDLQEKRRGIVNV